MLSPTYDSKETVASVLLVNVISKFRTGVTMGIYAVCEVNTRHENCRGHKIVVYDLKRCWNRRNMAFSLGDNSHIKLCYLLYNHHVRTSSHIFLGTLL
jgi:hypothetical protein